MQHTAMNLLLVGLIFLSLLVSRSTAATDNSAFLCSKILKSWAWRDSFAEIAGKFQSHTRFEFRSPKLSISAHGERERPTNVWHLPQIILLVRLGRSLTPAEMAELVNIFKIGNSKEHFQTAKFYMHYYTTTRAEELDIENSGIIELYREKGAQLRSINEEPPLTTLSGKILGGPIAGAPHQWKSLTVAYEAQYQGKPELGFHWDSVNFYRDGFRMRTARAPNMLYSLFPITTSAHDVTKMTDQDLQHPEVIEMLETSLLKDLAADGPTPTNLSEWIENKYKGPQISVSEVELQRIRRLLIDIFGIDTDRTEFEVYSN